MSTFRRGKAARERESLKRGTAFPNRNFTRTVRHCVIMQVIGPEDATGVPAKTRELYHIFVRVVTPMGEILTVPMDGNIHSIMAIDGNAPSLVGKKCTVEYIGQSIEEASSRGFAKIERDMQARIPAEKAALSIAGLLGMVTGNHSEVGRPQGEEYEGTEN